MQFRNNGQAENGTVLQFLRVLEFKAYNVATTDIPQKLSRN